MHHTSTQAGLATLPLGMVCQPTRQRLRAVEREHATTRGHWVQSAREAGLSTSRLVAERQRPLNLDSRPVLGVRSLILASLWLNAGQRHAGLLRLDDAHSLTVHVQHIAGTPSRGLYLPDSYSQSRRHRCCLVVLHYPAAGFQLLVDVTTGQLLGRQVLTHSDPRLTTANPHTSGHRTILNRVMEVAQDRS